MADVHAQRDLGLAPVAAEVSFAGEQAEQVAGREVARAAGPSRRARLPACCFTVKFHVEHRRAARCFTVMLIVERRRRRRTWTPGRGPGSARNDGSSAGGAAPDQHAPARRHQGRQLAAGAGPARAARRVWRGGAGVAVVAQPAHVRRPAAPRPAPPRAGRPSAAARGSSRVTGEIGAQGGRARGPGEPLPLPDVDEAPGLQERGPAGRRGRQDARRARPACARRSG